MMIKMMTSAPPPMYIGLLPTGHGGRRGRLTTHTRHAGIYAKNVGAT